MNSPFTYLLGLPELDSAQAVELFGQSDGCFPALVVDPLTLERSYRPILLASDFPLIGLLQDFRIRLADQEELDGCAINALFVHATSVHEEQSCFFLKLQECDGELILPRQYLEVFEEVVSQPSPEDMEGLTASMLNRGAITPALCLLVISDGDASIEIIDDDVWNLAYQIWEVRTILAMQ